MSSKFEQIRSWTAELAALEPLEKYFTYLRTMQDFSMTCRLSGERSLPFGLLVQSCRDGATASWVLPVLLGSECVLLKDTTRRR